MPFFSVPSFWEIAVGKQFGLGGAWTVAWLIVSWDPICLSLINFDKKVACLGIDHVEVVSVSCFQRR